LINIQLYQMIVKSGNQYFGHHDPRSITGLTLGL